MQKRKIVDFNNLGAPRVFSGASNDLVKSFGNLGFRA